MRTRVSQQTIDKLNRISEYLVQERGEDKFYSQDDLINETIDYYFKSKGINYQGYTPQEIKDSEKTVEFMKLSPHITKSSRADLKKIGRFLKDEGIIEGKKIPGIEQIITYLINEYKHTNPDLKLKLDESKLLAHKSTLNKEKAKRTGYD